MATTAERIYKLTVQADQAKRQLKQFTDQTGRMNKNIENAGRQLKNFAKIAAGAFSVRAIVGFARETARVAEQIDLASQKIGVTAEQFQVFAEAAQRVGLSASAAETGFQRFSRRAAEAANGTGVLKKEFDNLGIATKNVDGTLRPIVDVLADYADAVAATKDPSEQLRLSVQAFDTEGAGMVNFLRNGRQGFEDLNRVMRENGQIMSSEQIAKTSELNQKWENMVRGIDQKMKSMILTAADFWDSVLGFTDNAKVAKVEERLREQIDLLADLQEMQARPYTQSRPGLVQRYDDEIARVREVIEALREERRQLRGLSTDAPIVNQAIEKFAGETQAAIAPVHELDRAMAELAENMRQVEAAGQAAATANSAVAIAGGEFSFGDITELTGLDDELASLTETMRAQADMVYYLGDSWGEFSEGAVTEMKDNTTLMLESFTTSFDNFASGVASGTASIKDLFKNMVSSLIAQFLKLMAYKGIMALLGGPGTELGGAFGKATGLIKSAKGNVFAGGNLVPFAKGGVTNIPTMFPMNGGKTGIMGEAGPEAIMPLRRGANGELGVNAVQPIVNVNNNAPVNVSTSSRADGTVDIEIIERVIETSIRRGGNAIAGAIESTYGVGRANGAFGY